MPSKGRHDVGGAGKEVTSSDANACISEPESDPVAMIAVALFGMSPADRARLAVILSGVSGVKG